MKALKQLGWLTLFVGCGAAAAHLYSTAHYFAAYWAFAPCLFLPRPWVR